MKVLDEKTYNHVELNNEVTQRDETGFYKLEKDLEALRYSWRKSKRRLSILTRN
jgi:Ribonucleotide reductase N-terminal.